MLSINHRKALKKNGYLMVEEVFSHQEINEINKRLENATQNNKSVQKNKELFAIRELFKSVPGLSNLLLNSNLKKLLKSVSGNKMFLTKAIYFDKPETSNWFVAYHQDLIISVDQKADIASYNNWTFKKGQFGVQPPTKILENTLTVRIHLDDTIKENGALKVIPKSHNKGVIKFNEINHTATDEVYCEIKKGGVMLMNPLLFHASERTTNGKKRRIIHLEFNHLHLAKPLQWKEFYDI